MKDPSASARNAAASCLITFACLGCAASPPPRSPSPPAPAEAERPEPPTAVEAPAADAIEASPASRQLTRAFVERLTVHTRRDGTRVLSRRCREGPVDCEARLEAFARILADAAARHGLDPFLLGALAFRESGLDPSAVARTGAAGIVQLHPRGVGRGMRYVTDRAYREACQSELEACQRPVVDRGAQALAAAVEECGSLPAALGAYATGHCTRRARHIRRVLEERERLRGLGRE